jgi:hypothetical protein
MIICNLVHFYNLNAIEQVVKVATTHFTINETIYICNSCNYVAIRSLQLLCHYIITIMPTLQLLCHYVATILQLHKQQCVDMTMVC